MDQESSGMGVAEAARSEVKIVIGTSPKGLTLAEEVRLVKPSLLYGDRVVLYGPVGSMLMSAATLGQLPEREMLALIAQVGPALGQDVSGAVEVYEELQRKRRRLSRQEVLTLHSLRRELRKAAVDLEEIAEGLLDEFGATQLVPALETGLLEMDPLVGEGANVDDADFLFTAWVAKLKQLISTRTAYPLFDEATGSLVRAAVAEDAWRPTSTAHRRGRQVGAATDFIAQVPAFPDASMSEILGIRDELREPLGAFRTAVSRFARTIESAQFDEDFSAEVSDLYDTEVAPTLAALGESIATNTYLRQLLGQATSDLKEVFAIGATLSIGLMGLTDLPDHAALGGGVAAAGLSSGVKAGVETRRAEKRLERDHLYFLYRADQLLSGR